MQPCRFRLWSTAERCFRLFPLSSPVAGAWTGRDLLRFSRLLQGSGSAMPVASLRLWGRRRARCRLCPRRQGRSACRVVAPQQRPVAVLSRSIRGLRRALGRRAFACAAAPLPDSPVPSESAAALQRRTRTRRRGTARKVRFSVTFRAITCASARSMLIPRPATPTAPAVNPSPCAAARGGRRQAHRVATPTPRVNRGRWHAPAKGDAGHGGSSHR
jgi:hypothetical protein